MSHIFKLIVQLIESPISFLVGSVYVAPLATFKHVIIPFRSSENVNDLLLFINVGKLLYLYI